MKKTGIKLLVLIMLLGGRTPLVLAEELDSDIDESTAETIFEESDDTSAATAEETAPSEIDESYDDSSDEETVNTYAEEQQNTLENEDVTITRIGEGEVKQNYFMYSMAGGVFAYRFTPRPAEGYHAESIKASDDEGNNIIQYDGGSYIEVIDRYDHINVEAVFVNDKNFAVRQTGEGEITDEHVRLQSVFGGRMLSCWH